MKFIKVLVDCKTANGSFYADEVRMLEDDVALELTSNGWGKEPSIVLNIDNSTIGVNTTEI